MKPHVKSMTVVSRAFTLMEILVAVGIASLILVAAAKLTIFSATSFAALQNYNDLDQASQLALDRMSREIRGATNCNTYTSTLLIFDNGRLAYRYFPGTRELWGTNAGRATRLLRQCDALVFHAYQRNADPSTNLSFYGVTNLTFTPVKLIDVSWKCSRQILQQKVNTESVQTARIVIRN
jgi:prepilin-type N-terminal cleavage/methylation domain-containing protein